MKRIFICMAAMSMVAACSKDDGITDIIDKGETLDSTPIEKPAESYTTYVEVATDNGDTRATYDNLTPMWEAGDAIVLHQMTAANGGDNSWQTLSLTDGANSSSATFGGEVTLGEKGARYFCFAYPDATVSTTDATEAVSTIDYKFYQDDTIVKYGYYEATGTYKHTYTTSVGITIPSEQDGSKWTPYMYAVTTDASTAGQLSSVHFTTLNGAICLRVKDTDGTSPKQLSSITISTKNGESIAGTYNLTSTSEGTLDPMTVRGKDHTIASEEWDADTRNDALKKLEDKARATSPATMTENVVSAPALSDGKNEITVTNIDNTKANKGEYSEYYINIAPVNATQGFTITLTDTEGLSLTFDTKAANIGASQRKGYNITWEADAIGVELDDATGELTTSYSDYIAGNSAAANGKDAYTIYDATIKGKINVSGNYKLSDINKYGLRVVKDGTVVKEVAYSYSDFPIDSATKTFDVSPGNIGVQSLGAYEYYLYIETSHGNFETAHKPLYITGLPYTCNVSQNDGWTTSNEVEFTSSYISLNEEGNGAWIKRNFYTPADINVKAESYFGCRRGSGRENIFHLYVSGTEIAHQNGDHFFTGYNASVHNFTNKSGILTAGNPTVEMRNTSGDHNLACYTRISSFKLEYGNK